MLLYNLLGKQFDYVSRVIKIPHIYIYSKYTHTHIFGINVVWGERAWKLSFLRVISRLRWFLFTVFI